MPLKTILLTAAAVMSLQSSAIGASTIKASVSSEATANILISTPASFSASTPNSVSSNPILAMSTAPKAEVAIAPIDLSAKKEVSGASVEDQVRAYFSDIPVMISIAGCESNFRQTDADGYVVRGQINPDDVGVMQINEHYNGESADKLGDDIMTLNGNMAFARHLYDIYGTKPWQASEKCWGGK